MKFLKTMASFLPKKKLASAKPFLFRSSMDRLPKLESVWNGSKGNESRETRAWFNICHDRGEHCSPAIFSSETRPSTKFSSRFHFPRSLQRKRHVPKFFFVEIRTKTSSPAPVRVKQKWNLNEKKKGQETKGLTEPNLEPVEIAKNKISKRNSVSNPRQRRIRNLCVELVRWEKLALVEARRNWVELSETAEIWVQKTNQWKSKKKMNYRSGEYAKPKALDTEETQ